MAGRQALAYVLAQLIGAALGALPLLLWQGIGRSIMFGATQPGPAYGPWSALGGEAATTAALVIGLFLLLGHRPARRFTPLLFPFLYALMVWVEAPLSGTSTNPARSFAPAVVSGDWNGFWVYVIGPAIGAGLAAGLHGTGWLRRFRIDVAKVYHFEEDTFDMFKRSRERSERARRERQRLRR